MNLRSYLQQRPKGEGVRLAKKLGVTPVMVSQWAHGLKRVPPSRCIAIEIATKSQVTRQHLRAHDWHQIWPELIGTEGAPAVPTSEPAEQGVA